LLRGRYAEAVGNTLFSAVADATMLAAWMAYDSTPGSPLAQRYYIQALGLAQAAGASGIAIATLTAHFHTMEARALARMGDSKACDRALDEAVREYERRKPEDDPGWFQYFDEAEL